MLELRDVDAFYGASRALKGVNLSVASGSFVSVLGRNGVGKTTLLRAVLGLMDKVRGSVILDGREINNLKTHQRAIAGLGYVPQGRGILPKLSVRENLMLGAFAQAKSNTDLVTWVLDLFPILKEFLERRGGNLSGGQQQQLAIARALLSEPKVILLDEPTEGIQPNIVEQIEDVLISLNRQHGKTIVLVEQNVAFARRASDQVVLIDRGSVAIGGHADILTDDIVHQYLAV